MFTILLQDYTRFARFHASTFPLTLITVHSYASSQALVAKSSEVEMTRLLFGQISLRITKAITFPPAFDVLKSIAPSNYLPAA